jgi:predicted DNA-binding transcriptional regulator AlpA
MIRAGKVEKPPAVEVEAPWWNTARVLRWLGISRATLERRLRDGTVPRPVKLGGLRLWNAAELAQFERRLLADRGHQ